MANDFPISYRQQAKKEISDDISADSADIYNRDRNLDLGFTTNIRFNSWDQNKQHKFPQETKI